MNAKDYLTISIASPADWSVEEMLNLALSEGYQFTIEELETAADELWGTLSEEQLYDVAGGGGNGRTGSGPVIITKSNMSGKKDGGDWAPPPGDVSGNSCFFTRR